MKRTVLLMTFSLLAATSGFAQRAGHVTADVPFDFYLGDKHFVSGEYDIRGVTNNGVTKLEYVHAPGRAALWLAGTSIPKPSAANDLKLVFHKYDADHCFLKEIYLGTGAVWTVPVSRTEREQVSSRVMTNVSQVKRLTVLARVR